jgi:hypothetical protein
MNNKIYLGNIIGATGPSSSTPGPIGAQGATGPAGSQGSAGGSTGPQGVEGATGPMGPANDCVGTSTTQIDLSSSTMAVGETVSLVTQSSLCYTVDQVILVSSADASYSGQYLIGSVTSYSDTALSFKILAKGGGSTISNWRINMTGTMGPTGPAGPGSSGAGSEISFRTHLSADQSITNSTTTPVEFDQVQFNVQDKFSITTSRFTPGLAGRYNLSAGLLYSSVSAPGTEVQIAIRKNGSSIVFQRTITVDDDQDGLLDPSIDCSVMVEADADDYFDVITWHDDSAPRFLKAAPHQCWFEGSLIAGGPGLVGPTGPVGQTGNTSLRGGSSAVIDVPANKTLDCSSTDVFHVKISADVEITLASVSAGQQLFILIESTSGTQNLNWGTAVKWQNGTYVSPSSPGQGVLYKLIKIGDNIYGTSKRDFVTT